MNESKRDKIQRVLQIYAKLSDGCLVNKSEEALNYRVNERSIQRDIEDIRKFLDADAERTGLLNKVIYKRHEEGYRLETLYNIRLKNSEILAMCKILLYSRAFPKAVMADMLGKLITYCTPKANQRVVRELIGNELIHYSELQNRSDFVEAMWEIGLAVRSCRYIEIDYCRLKDKATVHRKIKPVAILFSKYYFYLMGFIEGEEAKRDFSDPVDSYPTIYRIDRIKSLKVLDDVFQVPYRSRFEEGAYRKRMQYMFGGRLQKVKFSYSGSDVCAILDELPTARVVDDINGTKIIEAEAFGTGFKMLLLSQGCKVKALYPESFVEEMRAETERIYNMYKQW
ncbi:WYL domain-containing protein [bacterium]|nr:WYL domain-containing protein [bacterium]